MKTVIRRGVFETNSSSTHSITIDQSDHVKIDHIPVTKDGVCLIYPGEYGWEREEYTDATTKASYALTWAKSQSEPDKYLEMLIDVIQQGTGATTVTFVSDKSIYEWGYIDHQSMESDGNNVGAEMFESKDTLFAAIFNRNSILMTDNDNRY